MSDRAFKFNDYEETCFCRSCHAPVVIHARAPETATTAILEWQVGCRELCSKCLNDERAAAHRKLEVAHVSG